MRGILLLAFVMLATVGGFGQTDLQKVIATEKAFAERAAQVGTKSAFLEFAAPEGLLFLPDKVKALEYWKARSESTGLLTWAPNYADVSSNGLLGYTTGNWEFRPGGAGSAPSGFGEFVTIWQRQPDGKYRFVIDIGIAHDKPAVFSTATEPPSYPGSSNENNSSAADTANSFFEIVSRSGLSKAYETYAADNVRAFREGSIALVGRKQLLGFLKKAKGTTKLTKRSVFFGSADIAYITNTYTRSNEKGESERGNFLQIWKLIDGRWQIVLDIFKPVPETRQSAGL